MAYDVDANSTQIFKDYTLLYIIYNNVTLSESTLPAYSKYILFLILVYHI